MKIRLGNQNKFAIVDEEDARRVLKYPWHSSSCEGAITRPYKNGKKKCIFLHRFVLNLKEHVKIKHKNGNRFDCRKKNLILLKEAKDVATANAKQNRKT